MQNVCYKKEEDKIISIRKRNDLYEYRFEAGKVNSKRKQIPKSGFKTKRDATYYFGVIKYDLPMDSQIPRVLSFELEKRYRTYLYK